jgi:hypothetical protein
MISILTLEIVVLAVSIQQSLAFGKHFNVDMISD